MFYASPFDSFLFSVFPVIFMVLFALVLVFFIATAIKGVGQWHTNNQSPRLTVDATVVAKREDVTHHHHNNAGDATGMHGTYTTIDTSYYATFEVKSGDRLEFLVSGREYAQLVEGDFGELTFQGTRYLGFGRI